MIRLITGLNGHGKSLYAVSLIIKLAQAGETIYTNITGLTVPDVLPIPDDFDWRKTPDGSYVFYDEAQYIDVFKSNGRENVSSNPICRDLSTHRKTGHEIYFITQDGSYLHKHILGLVNQHINVFRPMGTKFPTAFFWQTYQPRPNSAAAQKKSDSMHTFTIKKDIHKYYISASQHNIRFDWFLLLKKSWIVIAAIVFIAYTLFFTNNAFISKSAIDNAASATNAQPNSTNVDSMSSVPSSGAITSDQRSQIALYIHELQRVAYVVEFGNECYAKNSYGELLDIPLDKCRMYSAHPSSLSSSRNLEQSQRSPAVSASSPDFSQTPSNDLNSAK